MPEIKEGDQAPEIELETDACETFRLSEQRGRKVVLYFYPRASTPGCTVESCEFRDANQDILSRGAVVVGVSPDTTAAQAKFKKAQRLTFPLLADHDRRAAQAYGVWKEKNMYGKKVFGIERTTFLIDEQGRVAKVFRKVKPQGHAAEVLKAL
jgi:peroxiredoxin Q/BCP